jgi:hypothetical protein
MKLPPFSRRNFLMALLGGASVVVLTEHADAITEQPSPSEQWFRPYQYHFLFGEQKTEQALTVDRNFRLRRVVWMALKPTQVSLYAGTDLLGQATLASHAGWSLAVEVAVPAGTAFTVKAENEISLMLDGVQEITRAEAEAYQSEEIDAEFDDDEEYPDE